MERASELARLKYEAQEASRLKDEADVKAAEYERRMKEEAERAEREKASKEAALALLKT